MALYTLRTGATAHPEDSVLQHLTDQINSSGVFDFAGNDFKVQAQATPDLTVKVIKGRAYIKAASGNSYPIRADADSNVSIGSNSSGNPRIDALVLFIDLSAAPNSDASNVAKLQVVQGTPAPSPSIPSDPVIQAEIGASNPFIRLANISVASGATSILNANITDFRVPVAFKVGKVELKEGRVGFLEQASTPSTPASGSMLVYPKTDNKLYKLDDLGVESEVGAGATGFMPNLLENGNFSNVSTNGYGNIPDNWSANAIVGVQGGFPELTKQQLIDILGITDGQIEGLWNLNGNFNDLSSNGYHLTPNNAPTDYANGLMAQAKQFLSASSQYATNPAANARISINQTFFCLFRPETIGVTQRIMGVAITPLTDFIGLQIAPNGHLEFAISQLTGSGFAMQQRVEAGKWYLLIGTYDGSTVRIFCNGIQTSFSTSGVHNASTGSFSVGRWGDFNADYFNGQIQCAGVLSTDLDNNKMRRLWAFLSHNKLKSRRSGSDGYISQFLSMDDVIKYRGKILTLGAEFYQNTASIESIGIIDNTGGSTSTPVATTNTWLEDSVSRQIADNATFIEVRVNVSTTNGNVWYRKVRLTETSAIVPYSHSPSDWKRFGDLLQLNPPKDGQGIYHFELHRDYPFTVLAADLTFTHATTYTSLSDYGSSYRFLSRKTIQWKPKILLQGFNAVLSYGIYLEAYVGIPEEQGAEGICQFYGTPGPGPGSYHIGLVAYSGFQNFIQKYDGGNITALGGFFYMFADTLYTIRDDA